MNYTRDFLRDDVHSISVEGIFKAWKKAGTKSAYSLAQLGEVSLQCENLAANWRQSALARREKFLSEHQDKLATHTFVVIPGATQQDEHAAIFTEDVFLFPNAEWELHLDAFLKSGHLSFDTPHERFRFRIHADRQTFLLADGL